MRWTLQEVADAVGGRLESHAPPGGAGVTGVSIDSRTIGTGELFVAVRAERDGHDFAAAAVRAGASGLLVERPTGQRVPEILVGDTAAALLSIGRAARRRIDGPVVAITGSVGKTSTKDLAAAALGAGRRTFASPRSFNNELGLPLTLANAPEDVEAVVLEMGARGPGHIALLCDVARPDLGVVTAVAAAHTEMFGDIDGVARAKAELVESLPAEGTAVLNGDDPRVREMGGRTEARKLLYSTEPARGGADVVADGIELDDELRPRFRVRSPWGTAVVVLAARGAHQVSNALAALAVAGVVGVDLEAAAAALADAPMSPLRMELNRSSTGAVIINDAYNANPASMAAALRALAAIPAQTRVAILGPMAELGASSRAEHVAIAGLAAQLGIEVVAIGTEDYGAVPIATPEEVVARLSQAGPETAVLVKASRVAALETVVAALIS